MSILHTATEKVLRIREIATRWWGGIGCRVAFLISLVVFLSSVFLGLYLLWESRRLQNQELYERAFFIGNYSSSLYADDIAVGNRQELYKKMSVAFSAGGDLSKDLLFMRVYDRSGKLLIDKTADSSGEFQPQRQLDDANLKSNLPVYSLRADGVILVMPVLSRNERIGFVSVGVSGKRVVAQSRKMAVKIILAVIVVLAAGLLFSQIIAAGIVKPLVELNFAVDKLSRQDWTSPAPVRGRDEISSLAKAFNQMALTLRERETSLSRGNRDLFLLHTAGLDLMESLELGPLLSKIAARAEDLIKSDTITIAAVDTATKTLKYLGAEGRKVDILKKRPFPLEAGGIFNWMASYGTPLLIADAQSDVRIDSNEARTLGITSLMTVPLWSSNKMIAVMTAINRKGGAPFDKHDLRLFTVFSNLAGAALQNAFLYQDLMRKMEELTNTRHQLVHSTKLAAIGELAANLAHEINNPLTSVLGYTSHLLKTLNIPEESRSKLQLMEQETLRVRRIIRNLLDFSRQKPYRKQPGDLLQPLRETVALLHGVAERTAVQITEDYPADSVLVNMDNNEIKQVFINIMNNALHAMPKGGRLSVRVFPGLDSHVFVEFEDTGHGIAKEHIDKIFEPFFSTKSSGDGTGLGLSISHRIIQNHGGRIEVESEVGQGALFRVVLPMCEQGVTRQ